MIRSYLFNIFAILAIACSISGCTKSDDGGSDGPGDPPDSGEPSEGFRTECGVVQGGELFNPVDPRDGDRATARVVGPNLLAIRRNSRVEEFVKLHGMDVPGSIEQRNRAETILEDMIAEGEVYFYQVDKTCTTTIDNGMNGVIGQVFSASGKNFSESLIKSGNADVGTDVCDGELIGACYRALLEDSITPTPTPEPEVDGPSNPAGFILWKPVSDSDGRLAVHSVPFGTTIIVDGETGTNRGPGNGYGSLARFRKNGCGYGRKPRIEMITSDGSKFMFGDKPFATVPDGCQRWVIDAQGQAKPNRK